MIFDINMWEGLFIAGLAAMLIGPRDLARHLTTLKGMLRELKNLADNARNDLTDSIDPELRNHDWSAYDPRQYHPKRILQDAWSAEGPTPSSPAGTSGDTPPVVSPFVGTPYDPEGT